MARETGRVEDFTIPALLAGLFNLLWVFFVLWSLFGFWTVLVAGLVLNHAITLLERRNRSRRHWSDD